MFEPENELESALVRAAKDPAERANFYRTFLAAMIYILPVGTPPEIKDGVVQAGSKLSVEHITLGGQSVLPCYSSLPRLQAAIREERRYLLFEAKSLLEITRGATLALNPGSDYGKVFLPAEISGLLDGSIFAPRETRVIGRDTKVLLGQPAKYPHDLVAALRRLYGKLSKVRAAYLAQYFDGSHDRAPGLLVALETTGDRERVVSESGICARGLIPEHDHLDFVELAGSGLTGYFSKVTPFYQQPWFRRLW